MLWATSAEIYKNPQKSNCHKISPKIEKSPLFKGVIWRMTDDLQPNWVRKGEELCRGQGLSLILTVFDLTEYYTKFQIENTKIDIYPYVT